MGIESSNFQPPTSESPPPPMPETPQETAQTHPEQEVKNASESVAPSPEPQLQAEVMEPEALVLSLKKPNKTGPTERHEDAAPANEHGGYSFEEAAQLWDKDPYERLGVSHDADPREIKKAYIRFAREFHPDLGNLPKETAEEYFKAFADAYDKVTDPDWVAQNVYHYDGSGDNIEEDHTSQYQKEADSWVTRQEPSPAPRFYGFAHGPAYEKPLHREVDLDGFFEDGLGVARLNGKIYAVNQQGFAVSRPYDGFATLNVHRLGKDEQLLYLLNALSKELSIGYDEFRIEKNVLIGIVDGLEYLIDPETGDELSRGFEKIFYNANDTLIGRTGYSDTVLVPKKILVN